MSEEKRQPHDDDQTLGGLDSLFEKLCELGPDKMGDMSPEQIQQLMGGAKLGEVIAKFQQVARKMADDLEESGQNDFDDGDAFDDEEFEFDSAVIDETFFQRPNTTDGSCNAFPGSQQLWQHALQLHPDERLQVSIEIQSPPTTRIEKIYYSRCHYRLIFDLFDNKVTFRDVTTPRQDYLTGKGWPAMMRLPRQTWPQLEPLWETVRVEQFNLRAALQSNNHNFTPRDDLVAFARRALQAGLGE
jgi:hypothetical protein